MIFRSKPQITLILIGIVQLQSGTDQTKLVAAATTEYQAVVEAEEVVTRYTSARNGAGPLWCYGSTVLARQGDDVYLSLIETGKDIPPLCNTRWQLWHRSAAEGWKVLQVEREFRQREPCPIAGFPDGAIFLSVNPSIEPPGTQYGRCRPLVLEFDRFHADKSYKTLEPQWAPGAYFTDHSYRGFAADGERGELLLLNINARSGEQFVSYRDHKGTWRQKGKIQYPIRSCYPQVALRNQAAHVLAIGDIVEPKAEWRKLKYEKLQRKWDYVFRRLFYTYTPNSKNKSFIDPREIDSVEHTGGHITNLDLYVDPEGVAHVLYLKRPHQYAFIRDKYFPGQPMTVYLEYRRMREGKIIDRKTLTATPGPNTEGVDPSYGRFHVDSKNTLYVLLAGTWRKKPGNSVLANYIGQINEKGDVGNLKRIPLRHPFRNFMTNTVRGGSKPSDMIDIFGIADDNPNLRYAKVRLIK